MKQPPSITKSDLITYGSFLTEASIPENGEKLIMFASDLVMNMVRNNYNPNNDAHVLAVTKAICSQVSYWVESGTSPMGHSDVSSYSLGEISVSIDKQAGGQNGGAALCQMSTAYLNSEYLLYRGLKHNRV